MSIKYKEGGLWKTLIAIKGDKGDVGFGIPIGGAIGQLIRKKTTTDYDAEWFTPNYEPAITKNTAFNKNYGTTATDVKMDGAKSVGSVDAIARIDHVHPTDTTRAPLSSPTFTGTVVVTEAAQCLSLKAGSTADHVYMGFYPDSQAQNTRVGWIGYGDPGSFEMTISNNAAGGNIALSPGSGGAVTVPGLTSSATLQLKHNLPGINYTSTPNGTNSYYTYANVSDSVDGGFVIGKGVIGTGTDIGIFSTSGEKVTSLGVGTAPSGTTGEIRATNNITAYYSDERLKDFHGTIPNALDKILALHGYLFTENEKAKELGYSNDRMQVGVSAQEVQAVLPEAVTNAPIGQGYLTVWYEKLVPLLIEAIKEQQLEIEALKAKVG